MNTINNILQLGSKILKNHSIKTHQIDTELLLSKTLKESREYILTNDNKTLNFSETKKFLKFLNRRKNNEPIAYIMNEKYFWKKKFFVDNNVLIPRPDSETVVEKVLSYYKHKKKISILDIGTGSGCLIISILGERKYFKGTAIDISKKAINIAKYNAKMHQLSNRIKFYKSSVDNFFKGKYDLIISNPPYICSSKLKYLDKDIYNFEPIQALEGGKNGLKFFEKIIKKSSKLLKKSGRLILEIGFDQKSKVLEIINKENFFVNNVYKDYGKNDRCIICTKL